MRYPNHNTIFNAMEANKKGGFLVCITANNRTRLKSAWSSMVDHMLASKVKHVKIIFTADPNGNNYLQWLNAGIF